MLFQNYYLTRLKSEKSEETSSISSDSKYMRLLYLPTVANLLPADKTWSFEQRYNADIKSMDQKIYRPLLQCIAAEIIAKQWKALNFFT